MTSCTFSEPVGVCTFNFDIDIVPDVIDFSKFFMRFDNLSYTLKLDFWTNPRQLITETTGFVPDIGPDITTYLAPETDLIGAYGFPCAPWADVPVAPPPPGFLASIGK